MADAEDLKSSGDFSSCGFDSHPGHHYFLLKLLEFPKHCRRCTPGVPRLLSQDRGNTHAHISLCFSRLNERDQSLERLSPVINVKTLILTQASVPAVETLERKARARHAKRVTVPARKSFPGSRSHKPAWGSPSIWARNSVFS